MSGVSLASFGPMEQLAVTLSGGFDGTVPATSMTGNPDLDASLQELSTRLTAAALSLAQTSGDAGSGVRRVAANYRSAELA